MALINRTHAIKAAFVGGFLLIFLNLIGLRSDIKFDRSPVNLVHMSSSLQWPKRTRTNNELISNTTKNSTKNLHNISPSNINHSTRNDSNDKGSNLKNSQETTYNNSINSSNLNYSNVNNNNTILELTNIIYNNRNNNESGDIKNISNSSYNATKDNLVIENNQNEYKNDHDQESDESIDKKATTTIANHHPLAKSEKTSIKKTKYQNFDVDINDNGPSLFKSIMKVFGLNPCPPIPQNLDGPIEVDSSPEELQVVEKRLAPKLMAGGRYKPTDCKAHDRVAIIVPFRDRSKHLPVLLKNLHPFLMKQQIDYGIFIVEQSNNGNFNRAKLMNVGFAEALKLYEWDCFIFHDVDLLPLDDRNLYTCPDQPRHMSVAVDTFGFKLPYSSIFGGVSALTTKQFRTVNGFSNSFWGWGGEDDDMSNRLKHVGFHIARYPVNIARYTMLSHKKEKANPKRYEKLVSGANRYNSDGLNSLKYKVLELKLKPLYTWIYVEITPENTS